MKKFFHDYGVPVAIGFIFLFQLAILSSQGKILTTLGYYEITACENDRDDTTSTSR